MQIDSYLSPCTKLKYKWIKNFTIKLGILNLIDEKVENTLEYIGTGDNFLHRTLMAQAVRLRVMKPQGFCKAKVTVNRTKQQPTDWEKIFTNSTSDRGIIYKVYKELEKLKLFLIQQMHNIVSSVRMKCNQDA